METILLTALQLLLSLLPQIGLNNANVNQILAMLIQIVPIVSKLSGPIVDSVKAIIAALQSSDDLTPEQLATLDALSAELDAQYDLAVANYLASKKGK